MTDYPRDLCKSALMELVYTPHLYFPEPPFANETSNQRLFWRVERWVLHLQHKELAFSGKTFIKLASWATRLEATCYVLRALYCPVINSNEPILKYRGKCQNYKIAKTKRGICLTQAQPKLLRSKKVPEWNEWGWACHRVLIRPHWLAWCVSAVRPPWAKSALGCWLVLPTGECGQKAQPSRFWMMVALFENDALFPPVVLLRWTQRKARQPEAFGLIFSHSRQHFLDVSIGNKASRKVVTKAVGNQNNLFTRKRLMNILKWWMLPSMQEGFPAVFMSANVCCSRHFRQCSCGIFTEGEAGLFFFLLLELTGESGKSKAEFSQDSKESSLTWTDLELQSFAFYFEQTDCIEDHNWCTRMLSILGCNPDAADLLLCLQPVSWSKLFLGSFQNPRAWAPTRNSGKEWEKIEREEKREDR